MFIGLKQWIWEDPTGKMVLVGQLFWNNGVSGKCNRGKYYGVNNTGKPLCYHRGYIVVFFQYY